MLKKLYPLKVRSETKRPGCEVSILICKITTNIFSAVDWHGDVIPVLVTEDYAVSFSFTFYTILMVAAMFYLVKRITSCYTAPSVYVAKTHTTSMLNNNSLHRAAILYRQYIHAGKIISYLLSEHPGL